MNSPVIDPPLIGAKQQSYAETVQLEGVDFVFPFTTEERGVLREAGIEPWMIDPERSPYEHDCPHMRQVHVLGYRKAFEAMNRAAGVFCHEIVQDKVGAMRILERYPDQVNTGSAYTLFSDNYHRLAIWAAQDFVRFVENAKQELGLLER